MKPIDAIKPENYDLLINNYYKNYSIEINSIKYEVGMLSEYQFIYQHLRKKLLVIGPENYLKYQK